MKKSNKFSPEVRERAVRMDGEADLRRLQEVPAGAAA